MIAVDWAALGLGLAAGTIMSVVFFAGLAIGMQRALQDKSTITTLALSAVLRIATLLSAGALVVTEAGPWAFAGYGIAFLVCRHVATALVRVRVPAGGAE